MAKTNGGTRILIAIVALVVTVGLAALAASRDWGGFEAETKEKLSHQHEEIVGLQSVYVTQDADLDKAMRHVYEDEIETPYIQEDVAEIKKDVAGLKKGMYDFALEQRSVNVEQRAVNQQILDKLDGR